MVLEMGKYKGQESNSNPTGQGVLSTSRSRGSPAALCISQYFPHHPHQG